MRTDSKMFDWSKYYLQMFVTLPESLMWLKVYYNYLYSWSNLTLPTYCQWYLKGFVTVSNLDNAHL